MAPTPVFPGVFVKQQLSSLDFVDGLIRKKLVLLTNNTVDSGGLDVVRIIISFSELLIYFFFLFKRRHPLLYAYSYATCISFKLALHVVIRCIVIAVKKLLCGFTLWIHE